MLIQFLTGQHGEARFVHRVNEDIKSVITLFTEFNRGIGAVRDSLMLCQFGAIKGGERAIRFMHWLIR